jgi:hypothetical protein
MGLSPAPLNPRSIPAIPSIQNPQSEIRYSISLLSRSPGDIIIDYEFHQFHPASDRREHRQLLRDYPDQWIAVDQGRVWAAGRNLGQVADEAERAGASPDAVHQFVASATMIL